MQIIMYMTFLALQLMLDLIVQTFPFLSLIEFPVSKCSHVPHLSSPHFFTAGGSCSELENLVCVNCCFRFFGCRRLIIRVVCSSIVFILFEFSRNFKFSLTALVTLGLFGLFVITSGNIFSLSGFFLHVRNSSMSSVFAFLVPFVIIASG